MTTWIFSSGGCPSYPFYPLKRVPSYPFLAENPSSEEPKPKLLSPDIFRLGRGLPSEQVGAQKFGMSLETREIKHFWWDIPGFCRDIPAAPEKFEKKKFVFNFRSLLKGVEVHPLN